MRIVNQSRLIDIRRAVDIFVLFAAGFFTSWILSHIHTSVSLPSEMMGIVVLVTQFLFLAPVVARERYWRNVSAYDALAIAKSLMLSGGLLAVAVVVVNFGDNFIKATHLLFWLLLQGSAALILLCGVRLLRRMLFERQSTHQSAEHGKRTLIYGTSSSSRSLAFRFSQDPSLGIRLIGFVTHDPVEVGSKLSGVSVLGTGEDLENIFLKHQIQNLIIAENFHNGILLREILQTAFTLGIKTQMIADLPSVGRGDKKSEILRKVELNDLLQRPRVIVDLKDTQQLIKQKVILVTGAGGSIGSELVRQILLMDPKKVLLLDQSELNLFEIENELRASGYTGIYFPILSDLKEKKILQKLFADHEPQIVFHAAAYKHVHLVENNGDAAILNNLLSTQLLLDCSLENKVSHFVMISSDKAVNPQGIMGSTKRACELMVAEAGEVSGRHYCSVRFGNVLGSSGSLIPLLTKQIDRGGPVTITHQDMERYFMLIPEAVSLVLKATSLAQPGEIHILKMGNSIKIRDIVQSLILLMGKTLDSIPIIYTGIRPGEKLKEELYLSGDELSTAHPDIVVLPKGGRNSAHKNINLKVIHRFIESIIESARNSDEGASVLLKQLVQNNTWDFVDLVAKKQDAKMIEIQTTRETIVVEKLMKESSNLEHKTTTNHVA